MPHLSLQQEEQFAKGVLFTLLAFLAAAVMSALGKVAAGFAEPLIIVFFQNSISFLMIIPMILHHGIKTTFYTKRLGMHFFRALTGTLCWYCLFFSIKLIGLSLSVLLIYSAPLWMPIMGHLFFKEKTHPKVWLGVAIGFIGIALVLDIHSFAAFKNYGVIMGLIGGILLALAMFAVRWLSTTERPVTIMTYYFLLATLLVAPLSMTHLDISATNLKIWAVLISIGLMLILGQLWLVKALQYASAVKLSPFIYSVIVFAALIDWLIWKEVPTLIQVSGMLLVIMGGLLAMHANKKINKVPP